jgi:hypothetical protein
LVSRFLPSTRALPQAALIKATNAIVQRRYGSVLSERVCMLPP